MTNLKKTAGMAALLNSLTLLVALSTFAALGSEGVESGVPARELQFVNNQPIGFYIIYGSQLILGFTTLVMVLNLHNTLNAFAPNLARYATALGLIGTGLYLSNGLIDLNARPYLAHLYLTNPSQAETAYQLIPAITPGLINGASMTFGLWLIAATWALLKSQRWPLWFCYLGLATGIINTFSPVTLTLTYLAYILNIVCLASLGTLILRGRFISAVAENAEHPMVSASTHA
jgi:hypothetical protein